MKDDLRYGFGANWQRFLTLLDDERLGAAERSLRDMLEVETLDGRRFLDVGCGSGLFSLAARRLGASVRSFDYDPRSVACAAELRRRFSPDDGDDAWAVEQGSILDPAYVASLGVHDVVYAWGVLHHTGDMWTACDHAARLVAPGGLLFVALYNDQGALSQAWTRVKRLYCSGPLGRAAVKATCVPAFLAAYAAVDLARGRSPLARHAEHKRDRGMSVRRDIDDWLGGYPFEVASPEAVFEFYRARGFALRRLVTCGGSSGNNQLVFSRSDVRSDVRRH